MVWKSKLLSEARQKDENLLRTWVRSRLERELWKSRYSYLRIVAEHSLRGRHREEYLEILHLLVAQDRPQMMENIKRKVEVLTSSPEAVRRYAEKFQWRDARDREKRQVKKEGK